jgi:hypothetical protein
MEVLVEPEVTEEMVELELRTPEVLALQVLPEVPVVLHLEEVLWVKLF